MAGRNYIYRVWFYLFLGSFFLGVFLMNMGNEVLLTENGIFSASSVNRLKYIEIDNGRFLRYVLKQRLGEGTAILLLSTTAIGLVSVYAWVIFQGVLAGMTITAVIIRFGIRGLLLLLGSLFPHQLLLIPAQVMLLGWCYENCVGAHFPGAVFGGKSLGRGLLVRRGSAGNGRLEDIASGTGGRAFYGTKRQRFLQQGIGLLWIVIVILIGCILESYVNPMLITDLVKIF